MSTKSVRIALLVGLTAAATIAPTAFAASHREAPLTALDRAADITDFFAFVSYDDPSKVTMILAVDPLLEPANGPNYFPFDPNIKYEIKVDNDHDAVADVVYEFTFRTEIRAPGVFTGYVGAGEGVPAPANSPAPVEPGAPVIPPAITALDGPGSEGLSLRQTYSVTRRNFGGFGLQRDTTTIAEGLFALPSNVGERTMPDYDSLYDQAIYAIGDDMRVFAGTVEDPFWIDLGAAFDTFNFRASSFDTGVPGVLSDEQDANDSANFAPDDVSGYNVNAIAIEVPIAQLTSTGTRPSADRPAATIGTWGATKRPRLMIRARNAARDILTSTDTVQVQRMANPLFNELIIGTGSKDLWSRSQPADDAQFADAALDPLLARVLNAFYEATIGPDTLPIPAPPRTDLLPLVQYGPPIAAEGTPPGPVADLLRLNTAIPPTASEQRSRLAFLTLLDDNPDNDDPAGFPNGRRVSDDVTDIAARVVAGVLVPEFNGFPHNRIGDGVNTNDATYPETFPYLAPAFSGRNSRHVDPGEPGCVDECATD